MFNEIVTESEASEPFKNHNYVKKYYVSESHKTQCVTKHTKYDRKICITSENAFAFHKIQCLNKHLISQNNFYTQQKLHKTRHEVNVKLETRYHKIRQYTTPKNPSHKTCYLKTCQQLQKCHFIKHFRKKPIKNGTK